MEDKSLFYFRTRKRNRYEEQNYYNDKQDFKIVDCKHQAK